LDKAKFRVAFDQLELEDAGPYGRDRILFEVCTNPGSGFGPLHKIASGGEVARFSLALKVCLAQCGDASTLIFDEADVGVGGAVAAAIGERLSELATTCQVLAITHSPQVAAAADKQWKIAKSEARPDFVTTRIDVLDEAGRQEEIARMLAGAQITHEARQAAQQLLACQPA
jgi:DNA repair protein RecN (Recombination protein N)